MRIGKQNMMGVSLVEAILALVILGTILMIGLRTFQSYRTDLSAIQVKNNVEGIIRGAAMYYYANCDNPAGKNYAALDPANSPANPFTSVKLSDLISGGYLAKAPPANPLVNSNYLIQFNLSTPTNYDCEDRSDQSTCQPIGTSYIWNIQVSVLVKDTKNAAQYLKMTGADCLTRVSGAGVLTCAAAGTNAANTYLSWERLPSMASPKGQSILWMTNPVIKQFKYEYEATHDINNPTGVFLCGS